MTLPNKDVCYLLMAQVINNALIRLRPKSDLVEIPLLRFLADLNNLAHSYKDLFQYSESYELFDLEFLEDSIKNSGFNNFSSIKDDVIQIEIVPQKFQALLTGIIVDASVNRSRTLIADIDLLRTRYTTASSEPFKSEELLPQETDRTALLVNTDTPVAEDTPAATPLNSGAQVQLPEDVETVDAVDLIPGPLDLEPISSKDETKTIEETANNELNISANSELSATSLVTDLELSTVPANTSLNDATAQITIAEFGDLEKIKSEDPSDEITLIQSSSLSPSESKLNLDPSEISLTNVDKQEPELKEEDLLRATPINEFQDKVELTNEKELETSDQDDGDDMSKRTRTKTHLANKRSASPLGNLSPHKHKRFQNIAVNLIRSIEGHRFSSPFLLPVSAPNYGNTVFEPTDLKTIMKALKLKQEPPKYETLKELERDIMLMFANCVMFNKSSTPIVDMAKEMKQDVSRTFKMFEEAESNIN